MSKAKEKPYVGIDLGGTNIFAAVIAPNGDILGEAKKRTKAALGADLVTARIARVVEQALKKAGLKKKKVGGIGIGIPGPIDPDTGIVHRCVNLGKSWDEYPLVANLQDMIGMPVTIDNDVNVGAVGEYAYGAGRGSEHMLALFVGTGLGGGLILNGKLFSGTRYSAAEAGHMVILADGPMCGCGEVGHAEALASRTAMERFIREDIRAGKPTIIPTLMGDKIDGIMTSGIIGRAYDAGDEVTMNAVAKAQYYLGLLISSCVNLLDPEVIVVGGGVVERMGEEYLDPVRPIAQQHYVNKSDMDKVRIVAATLGDYSGAMGAAVLAKQRLG